MKRLCGILLFPWLAACSGGGSDGGDTTDAGSGGGGSGAGGGAGGASADAADLPPDVGTADPGPLPTLLAVSGDLTFVERFRPGDATTGHLYSALADGTLKQRLTATAGAWGAHAVGPDKRYIVAIRHRTADGVDADDAPGEVWLIDVKRHEEYAVSPPGCDATRGGVGWRDEVQIMFSASCDGQPATVYQANRDDRTRNFANLLPIPAGDEPVAEVFPAVGTSIFAYVAEHQVCSGGDCFIKPQLWVADAESDVRCLVTDGELGFDDQSTVTAAAKRLGDHTPAFSLDLQALTFARNVGGKGAGPRGHLDPFRVGVDLGALYGGLPTCAVPNSLTDLTERLVMDDYPTTAGGNAPADEWSPQLATAGGLLSGGLLYVARREGFGVVYYVDRMGTRTPLSNPAAEAVAARWVTAAFDTSGVR
jgi:hypothetical protein